MNNFKMIHFCQRCNKEHDRTNKSMFETSVKCDFCNGFVVSPSGRAIIKIVLTAGIYIVQGKIHSAWIMAKNKSDALDHFIENVETDYNKVKKLTDQELQDSMFMFDPESKGNEEDFIYVSGKDLITEIQILPAIVYVITNEELIEANRRKIEREEAEKYEEDGEL